MQAVSQGPTLAYRGTLANAHHRRPFVPEMMAEPNRAGVSFPYSIAGCVPGAFSIYSIAGYVPGAFSIYSIAGLEWDHLRHSDPKILSVNFF